MRHWTRNKFGVTHLTRESDLVHFSAVNRVCFHSNRKFRTDHQESVETVTVQVKGSIRNMNLCGFCLFSRSLRETHFSTGHAGSRVFVLCDCNQVRARRVRGRPWGTNARRPPLASRTYCARCIHPRAAIERRALALCHVGGTSWHEWRPRPLSAYLLLLLCYGYEKIRPG